MTLVFPQPWYRGCPAWLQPGTGLTANPMPPSPLYSPDPHCLANLQPLAPSSREGLQQSQGAGGQLARGLIRDLGALGGWEAEGRHWGWQEQELPTMMLGEGRGREGRLSQPDGARNQWSACEFMIAEHCQQWGACATVTVRKGMYMPQVLECGPVHKCVYMPMDSICIHVQCSCLHICGCAMLCKCIWVCKHVWTRVHRCIQG